MSQVVGSMVPTADGSGRGHWALYGAPNTLNGVPSLSLARIPNWADGTHIKSLPRSDNEFLQQHNLENQFVVMYSGNHGVVHEFETLVALLRETHRYPNCAFVL